MNRGLVLLVSCFLLAGCDKPNEVPAPANPPPKPGKEPTASGNPLTAPTDYLGAVAQAKKSAEKTIDTVGLNQAIQLFHASEGRYPADLNELVKEKYIGRIPDAPAGMKIQYNAANGEVKILKTAN